MKRTLTRILSLCAAVCGLQVFGVDPVTPVAVWKGDFGTTEKNNITITRGDGNAASSGNLVLGGTAVDVVSGMDYENISVVVGVKVSGGVTTTMDAAPFSLGIKDGDNGQLGAIFAGATVRGIWEGNLYSSSGTSSNYPTTESVNYVAMQYSKNNSPTTTKGTRIGFNGGNFWQTQGLKSSVNIARINLGGVYRNNTASKLLPANSEISFLAIFNSSIATDETTTSDLATWSTEPVNTLTANKHVELAADTNLSSTMTVLTVEPTVAIKITPTAGVTLTTLGGFFANKAVTIDCSGLTAAQTFISGPVYNKANVSLTNVPDGFAASVADDGVSLVRTGVDVTCEISSSSNWSDVKTDAWVDSPFSTIKINNTSDSLVTLTLNENVTAGSLEITGGPIKIVQGSAATADIAELKVPSEKTVEFGSAATIASKVTGSGTVRYNLGSGTQTTAASLTLDFSEFTGTVLIDSGRIQWSNTALPSTVTLAVDNGGQAWLGTGSGTLTWPGALVLDGNGWTGDSQSVGQSTVRFTGTVSVTGSVTINGHTENDTMVAPQIAIDGDSTATLSGSIKMSDGFKRAWGGGTLKIPTITNTSIGGTVTLASGNVYFGNGDKSGAVANTEFKFGDTLEIGSGCTFTMWTCSTSQPNETETNKPIFGTAITLNGGTFATDDGSYVYSGDMTVSAASTLDFQWKKGQVIKSLKGSADLSIYGWDYASSGYTEDGGWVYVKGGNYSGKITLAQKASNARNFRLIPMNNALQNASVEVAAGDDTYKPYLYITEDTSIKNVTMHGNQLLDDDGKILTITGKLAGPVTIPSGSGIWMKMQLSDGATYAPTSADDKITVNGVLVISGSLKIDVSAFNPTADYTAISYAALDNVRKTTSEAETSYTADTLAAAITAGDDYVVSATSTGVILKQVVAVFNNTKYSSISDAIKDADNSDSAITIKSASTADITGKTIRIDKDSTAKFTPAGSGVVIVDGAKPTTVLDGLTAEAWTGIVWIKNVLIADFDFANYGSKIKLTGVTGYADDSNYGYDGTVILADEGTTLALNITNGYGGYKYYLAKVAGDGTFKLTGSPNSVHNYRIKDVADFTGAIDVSGTAKLSVTIGTDEDSYADGGQILINKGATACIAAGKTWNANAAGDHKIEGTLVVDIDGVVNTSTSSGIKIIGSGTLVHSGRNTDTAATFPAKIKCAGLGDSAWTGTVVLKDFGGNKDALQIPVNSFGNTGSKVGFTGVKGYLQNVSITPELVMIDNGTTNAWTVHNGSSSWTTTITKLSGTGTIVNSGNVTQTYQITNGSGFTGSIKLEDATGKNFVFGSSTPSVNSSIIVDEGHSITNGEGKIWIAAGGISLNGTLTVYSTNTQPTSLSCTDTAKIVVGNKNGDYIVYAPVMKPVPGSDTPSEVKDATAITNTVAEIIKQNGNPTGIYTYTKDGVTTTNTCVAVTNELTTTTVGVMAKTTVNNFLDLSQLNAGDVLSWYDATNKNYMSWQVEETDGVKSWKATINVSGISPETTAGDPSTWLLAAGDATILTKKAESKAVQLFKGTIATTAGVSASTGATLKCLPSLTDKKITEVTADGSVELYNSSGVQFAYSKTKETWYKPVVNGSETTYRALTDDDTDHIPAGTGIFLRNYGTDAVNVK